MWISFNPDFSIVLLNFELQTKIRFWIILNHQILDDQNLVWSQIRIEMCDQLLIEK